MMAGEGMVCGLWRLGVVAEMKVASWVTSYEGLGTSG